MSNWNKIEYETLPEHIRHMLERPESFEPMYMYLKEGRFAYMETKNGTFMAQVDKENKPTGIVYKEGV